LSPPTFLNQSFNGNRNDFPDVKIISVERHWHNQSVLSVNIKQTDFTYLCTCASLSRANRQTNLHQILYRPSHQLREGSSLGMTLLTRPPDPGVLQNINSCWSCHFEWVFYSIYTIKENSDHYSHFYHNNFWPLKALNILEK